MRHQNKALAALLPLMLAACMGTEAPAPIVAEPDSAVKEAPAPTPVETAPVVEEIAPQPAPEPGRLMSLSPAQVQNLIGEPSFVRRDDTVQTMLFENRTCVFEIIFLEPGANAHFEAAQLAARTPAGLDVDLQTCLASHLPGGQWLDSKANQP